jgi:drug/metabolite transporter (DMT)-like permease
MALSALFFGEHVETSTWIYAAAVIATVVLGRRASIRTAAAPVVATSARPTNAR